MTTDASDSGNLPPIYKGPSAAITDDGAGSAAGGSEGGSPTGEDQRRKAHGPTPERAT